MQDKDYYVIVSEMHLSNFNTRGGVEKLKDGKYKIWYGKGRQISGPLGENARQATIEEDIGLITEAVLAKGLQEQDFELVVS
jgi:hypothetical protein